MDKDESRGLIFVMSNSDSSITKILFRKSSDRDKYFVKARRNASSYLRRASMQRLGFSLSLVYEVNSYNTVCELFQRKIVRNG
ncbi:hypothetical protein ACTNC1_08965 [Atopobiaceae bacterium HCP3S3_A4]